MELFDTLFPTKDNVSGKSGEDGKPSQKQPESEDRKPSQKKTVSIEDLIVRGREFLLEHPDVIGEKGHFLVFDIPSSQNCAKLDFRPCDREGKERLYRFSVGAFREGTNKVVSQYQYFSGRSGRNSGKGSKEEIFAYLETQEGIEQIAKSVRECNESLDDEF